MNGILCIHKPRGFTSFDVVAKMRGIAKTRKIGHGGTLDPMATGVLPLFLNNATKACDLATNQDKRYTAVLQLGVSTDTYDVTGTVLERREAAVSTEEVERVVSSFVGEIDQLPPMYSAVQVDGKRLYDLARQGIEVARTPRRVVFYAIDILERDPAAGTYTLDVRCSKGTYIRSLCHDIGGQLGCGGVLAELVRTEAGMFSLEDCITLDEAQLLADEGRLADKLLPVDRLFGELPRLELTPEQARLLQNGVPLSGISISPGSAAAYTAGGVFLGLVRLDEDTGKLRVVKLFQREAVT